MQAPITTLPLHWWHLGMSRPPKRIPNRNGESYIIEGPKADQPSKWWIFWGGLQIQQFWKAHHIDLLHPIDAIEDLHFGCHPVRSRQKTPRNVAFHARKHRKICFKKKSHVSLSKNNKLINSKLFWNLSFQNCFTQLRVFNTDRWQVDSSRNLGDEVHSSFGTSFLGGLSLINEDGLHSNFGFESLDMGNNHSSETTLSTPVFWLERNTFKHGLYWDVWYINIYEYMYDNTKLHNVTVKYNIYILRTCIGNLFSFRIQPEVQNPTQNQAGHIDQKLRGKCLPSNLKSLP